MRGADREPRPDGIGYGHREQPVADDVGRAVGHTRADVVGSVTPSRPG